MSAWALALSVALAGTFVTSTIVAGIVTGFVRETTGMHERWYGKTMAERDILTNNLAALNIQDNVSSNGDESPSDPNGDFDGDGLSNGIENGSLTFNGADDPGTEAKNPDTDGDGVDDGTEVDEGTDPTDPNDGGVDAPPVSDPTSTERGGLIIDQAYKEVNGEHLIHATVGSPVTFHLHARVELYGPQPRSVEIVDYLPGGIAFENGRIESNFGKDEFNTWPGRKRFKLVRPGVYTFDIYLNTKVTSPGLLENKLEVFEVDNSLNRAEDIAYIIAKDGGTLPLPPLLSLIKEGRLVGGSIWHRHAYAKSGDTLEFRIRVGTGDFSTGEEVAIKDTLPSELTYVAGSAILIRDNEVQEVDPATLASRLFGAGYSLGIPRSNYQVLFSAKLEAGPTFDLRNIASGFVDSILTRESITVITPRP